MQLRPRRWLRRLGNVLIVFGVLALADVVVTMVWQEPLSALYATFRQAQLRGSLKALAQRPPAASTAALLAVQRGIDQRIALLAKEAEARDHRGSAVGEIALPTIFANYALVDGTGTEELMGGPGIYNRSEYPTSRFPGAGPLTAIAGHRTTFLAPFRHLNDLRPGQPIVITMPYGRFHYVVRSQRTVPPEDVGAAIAPPRGVNLVLSSCNPPFSASERLLVYAHLRSVTPLGPALAYQQLLVNENAPRSLLGKRLGLPPAAPGATPW